MAHPRWARSFLSDEDFAALGRAIREAEARTSGEIRVHLERKLPGGVTHPDRPLHRAQEVLHRLEMHRSKLRNAVLIYVAIEDHRLAIVGDEGIHQRVGDQYWTAIRDAMVTRLKAGSARDALVHAVTEVGLTLGQHFPRYPDQTEDRSDHVTTA